MTPGQKRNIERLKKLQIEAKKIRANNPKLSHIEAVKIASGKTPGKKLSPAKKKLPVAQKIKTVGAKKITEKKILQKIHKVKKNVNELNEAQHKHMSGNVYNTPKHALQEIEFWKKELLKEEKALKNPKFKEYKPSIRESIKLCKQWINHYTKKLNLSIKLANKK
jgi:hypothetical protein